MLSLIAFACFDVAGVVFMLYVLVNFHHDLKRSRAESTRCRSARVTASTKTRSSIPTVSYAPILGSSTRTRTPVGALDRNSQGGREVALRSASR
jgi:hypothetical protein